MLQGSWLCYANCLHHTRNAVMPCQTALPLENVVTDLEDAFLV